MQIEISRYPLQFIQCMCTTVVLDWCYAINFWLSLAPEMIGDHNYLDCIVCSVQKLMIQVSLEYCMTSVFFSIADCHKKEKKKKRGGCARVV